MVGHERRVGGRDALDVAHTSNVMQELDQFVGAACERVGAGAQVRVIVEQRGQMMTQHATTGAGGHDDVVVAAECREHALGHRPRGRTVAAIIGRLAAAGLGTRHFDPAAGLLQQTDRGKANRGPVEVHETGDEERDAGLAGHKAAPDSTSGAAGPVWLAIFAIGFRLLSGQ